MTLVGREKSLVESQRFKETTYPSAKGFYKPKLSAHTYLLSAKSLRTRPLPDLPSPVYLGKLLVQMDEPSPILQLARSANPPEFLRHVMPVTI